MVTDRERARDELRTSPIEWGVAFDAQDREVLRVKGTEHAVHWNTEDLRTIYERATTLGHNHPWMRQTGFSGGMARRDESGDLRFFFERPRLINMEVYTMDGTYVLTKQKPISPTRAVNLLKIYRIIWRRYQLALRKNAENIAEWDKEGCLPEGRAGAFIEALGRIAYVGAISRLTRRSDGLLKLAFYPVSERTKNKFELDMKYIDLIDEAFEKYGSKPVMIYTKEFLINKKPGDPNQYDPHATGGRIDVE